MSSSSLSAPLRPVADTWSGAMASERPAAALAHYEQLASQVWLSPHVEAQANPVLESVGKGRVAWCSLSGPYGWGKTATSVAIWQHATREGFWAVPPLSCTHFDEMARALVALLGETYPSHKRVLDKIYREVWERNLSAMSRRDAAEYEVEERALKRLLDDKARSGELTFDSKPHRFVELLARVGALAAREGRGLVVVLDELQQLLGALDARSTVAFREFVWSIRTENAPVAVFLSLDSLLEARLGQWASDVLHRIREHGPVINLRDAYTAEFPRWLWAHVSPDGEELTGAVLDALGQYVERSDLASGPRTVVDVFARAQNHFALKEQPYDIPDLVSDVRDGTLRYFGEGAPVQRVLRELEADPWVASSSSRRRFVALLAAFPSGIAPATLEQFFPDDAERKILRDELFGPLLVNSTFGLGLENLSRVRRNEWGWEGTVARAFDGLPALDVLASHAPALVSRTLVPMLFSDAAGWKLEQQDAYFAQNQARDGSWSLWRGSFAPEFPERRVALWIGNSQPDFWPSDVDVSLALVCVADTNSHADCELDEAAGRATFRLPVLRPLREVPPNIARLDKHLEPEPFRAATLMVAAQELDALLQLETGSEAKGEAQGAAMFRASHGRNFANESLQWCASEIFGGTLQIALPGDAKKAAVSFQRTLRGLEIVRAAFTALCRARFGDYQTLQTGTKWRASLETITRALKHPDLNAAQKSGARAVEGVKAEIVSRLFDQNSTAAFDSLARNLGPLVQTGGDATHWRLTFSLHPLEEMILEATRQSASGLDDGAAQQWGARAGYLPAEVAVGTQLLEARGLLERRSHARWFALAPPSARRDAAQEKQLAQLRQQWESLDIESWLADKVALASPVRTWLQAPVPSEGEIGEQLATLREQMRGAVALGRAEKLALEEQLVESLGELRAFGGADFRDSAFAVHLNGVAKRLQIAFDGALSEGRNLRAKIERSGEPRDDDDFAWADRWARERASWVSATRDWSNKQARLLERSALLEEWKSASLRESQVRARVESARDYATHLAADWDQFTSKWRQSFALEGWDLLDSATDFEAELAPIEAALHNQEWACMQGLLATRHDLRERFGTLLRSNAPEFCATASQESLNHDFKALWNWALAEFDQTLKRAMRLKARGNAWRHPTNDRKKWDELLGEVTTTQTTATRTLERSVVWELGTKIEAMWRGFKAEATSAEQVCGKHNSKSSSNLDFDQLALLLEKGLISITVEAAEK